MYDVVTLNSWLPERKRSPCDPCDRHYSRVENALKIPVEYKVKRLVRALIEELTVGHFVRGIIPMVTTTIRGYLHTTSIFFNYQIYKQSSHRRKALIFSLLWIDLKTHCIHLSHHTLLWWQSTLAPPTVDLPFHSSKTVERVEYSRAEDGWMKTVIRQRRHPRACSLSQTFHLILLDMKQ